MSGFPGVGVMIQQLRGGNGNGALLQAAIGKAIARVEVDESSLTLRFAGGTGLIFRDEGQSCCEHRYMVCDDDLREFAGAEFAGATLKDAPNEPDEYGEHEVQFLEVQTNRGPITVANHNEHNGYYGGFAIDVAPLEADQ